MARKIEVIDYRPEWADMYKREAKKIRSILGKNCKAVYPHRQYISKRHACQTDY